VPFHKLLISYAETLCCLLRSTFIRPYMLCTSVYTGSMHDAMVYAFHNYVPFEKNIQGPLHLLGNLDFSFFIWSTTGPIVGRRVTLKTLLFLFRRKHYSWSCMIYPRGKMSLVRLLEVPGTMILWVIGQADAVREITKIFFLVQDFRNLVWNQFSRSPPKNAYFVQNKSDTFEF
jgi:hypothetical protein